MLILSIILFFLSLLTLLMSYFYYNKNIKIFDSMSIEEIHEETESNINIIIERLFIFDILKIYVSKNDTLSTTEMFEYVKSIFSYFKSITPKSKYRLYNEKLNKEYDSFVIKCIYYKLMNIELDFKIKNDREKN